MKKELFVMTFAVSLSMLAASYANEAQTHQPLTAAADSAAAATTQIPAEPASMRMQRNARLFIEATDFGKALSAAIMKKKVPVVAINDRDKAEFFVETASQQHREGAAERVAKVVVLGWLAGSGRSFDGTATVTNKDGAIVFAHSSRKNNIRSATEDIAKQLKKHIERK